MTKIGAMGEHPESSNIQTAQKSMQNGIVKFENALSSMQISKDANEKARLQDIMDQQMALIAAAVRELHRSGIQKEQSIVDADYQRYRTSPTPENLTALQQDLSTLKDYSFLPELGS